MLTMWSNPKKALVTIRCNRCSCQGPAKGLWVLFRGIKPVCARHQSEYGVTAQSRSPSHFALAARVSEQRQYEGQRER
jgi:hypothetical protein